MTTIRRILLGYVVIAMLLGAGVAYATTRYVYNSIDYPGATYTEARGINDSGEIVGWYHDASGSHGFLKVGTTYTPINYPGISDSTDATGINDSRQIVGEYFDGKKHGFLKAGTAYTPIDYLGATGTVAWDINSSGQIVGGYFDASGNEHGFLKVGTAYTPIDYPGLVNPGGTTYTKALGINDSGKIVGYYGYNNAYHGFLKAGTDYTSIDYPGATDTLAWSINAFGHIVGYYNDGKGGVHGFIATPISSASIYQVLLLD